MYGNWTATADIFLENFEEAISSRNIFDILLLPFIFHLRPISKFVPITISSSALKTIKAKELYNYTE